MFGTIKAYGTITYTIGVWKSWEALRCHLLLTPAGNLLPTHWRLSNIINALHLFVALSADHTIVLDLTLGKLGATTAKHLWDALENSWKGFEEKMSRLRSIPPWLHDLISEFLEAISTTEGITWNRQVEPKLWCWSNDMPTDGGFILSNSKIYSLLLQVSKEWEYLNKKWDQIDSEKTWSKRWKMIWGSDLTRQSNIFIWKICMNGLFT